MHFPKAVIRSTSTLYLICMSYVSISLLEFDMAASDSKVEYLNLLDKNSVVHCSKLEARCNNFTAKALPSLRIV